MSSPPLLSIGIPLYAAAEFYDNIVSNIDGIDYPNVEILISDRHGLDDTIERLEERYRDDDRVTTHQHDDGLGWWHNYNFLLAQASGKYFRWLPQDDLLPKRGLDKLVDRLEEDPEIILVYNLIENLDAAGRVVSTGGHDLKHAAKRRRPWRYRDALSVAAQLHHQGAGAGILRRDQVVAAGIAIPPVRGGLGGTLAFRYALACRGRFEMVTDVVGHYRWHTGNYSVYTRKTWRNKWDYFKVARSFDQPGGTRAVRVARNAALLVASVIVGPAIQFAWWRSPRGRLARRTLRSE